MVWLVPVAIVPRLNELADVYGLNWLSRVQSIVRVTRQIRAFDTPPGRVSTRKTLAASEGPLLLTVIV